MKAVVLLSGGIDSSTSLAIAKAEGYELYALSFDYHQRHKRELESAIMVVSAVGVEKSLVIRFDLREIGGSALTSEIAVPKRTGGLKGQGAEGHAGLRKSSSGSPYFRTPEQIPVTYVPARNTIFLSFALSWAEVLGAENIFIGANAVDYSGYPDCRPEYLRAFEDMANLATKASVEGDLRFRVKAPLLSMTKADIIRKGLALGLDYSLTWSCYDPDRDGRPCRKCDSCLFRAKGFHEAGMRDPLLHS
jgi:7-cyano-7-deazaguanine synthase